MIHEINPANPELFFLSVNDDMLIGTKFMKWRKSKCGEDWLETLWGRDYPIYNKKEWFWTEPSQQSVLLNIPCRGKYSKRSRQIAVIDGLRVHPALLSVDGSAPALTDACIEVCETEDYTEFQFRQVPVLFYVNDILFFNGEDVSVEAFRLPDKEEAYAIWKDDYGIWGDDYGIEQRSPLEIPFEELASKVSRGSFGGFPYFDKGDYFLLFC